MITSTDVWPDGLKIVQLRRNTGRSRRALVMQARDDGTPIDYKTWTKAEAGGLMRRNSVNIIAGMLDVHPEDIILREHRT